MAKLTKLNALLIMLAVSFASHANNELQALGLKIDGIASGMISPGGPGCSVGVIQNRQFLFKKSYGMANVEHSVKLTSTSKHRMASVSKQFTAFAVLLLADDGSIALSDDIRKYLPGLHEYQHTVTINAMLGHFAGMGDYDTLKALLSEPLLSSTGNAFRLGDEDYLSNDEYYEMLKSLPLLIAPEQEQRYSNFAYNILTLLVERVSGMSFRTFTQKRIFDPLGMHDTFFADDKREVIRNRAYGYRVDEKNSRPEVFMTNLYITGDGGLFTTLDDMLLWDNHFSDPKLGKDPEGLVNLMNTPNGDFPDTEEGKWYYANGQYTDGRFFFHNGGWLGTSTSYIRRPDTKTSVVAMCNSSSLDANALSYPMFQILSDSGLWEGEDASVY
ncbi:MAG: penicillin-binding protein [Alteromonadaceae bacterium]|nr:penicillin-binding protein [Alteromonadaceae bacterium]